MSINKVSFGGKSLQNLVFDGGKSEYFYFKAGANTDWFNVQNWYKDSGFTVPANELPGNDDIAVVLNSNLSSSTSQTVKIGYLIFERNISRYDYSDQWDNNNPGNFTLSASLKINATVAVIIKNYDIFIQPAWVWASITNYATITAPSITIDSCTNYGTLNGAVTFYTSGQYWRWEGAGYNYGTINGNANFYGYSVNMGIVNVLTSSSFNETSINGDSGIVNGAVTFNNNSYWTWFSYVANAGTVNGDAVFNNTGNYGNINGSAVFNNTNHEYGTINGDVTFNNGWNYSTISNGNVVFNGNSYNGYGTINNSTQTTTFNGSSAHEYWASISGGNVIFNSYSSNYGYVNVNNLTFNNSSYNEYWGINASTVTFNNNAYNNSGDSWTYGIYSSSIIFNNSSYMYGSVNSTSVTFNDNSYSQSSAYRIAATSVVFNDNSVNNCPYVEGTSTFNDTSYNSGGVYDAIFNDSSYNNNFVDNTAIFNNNSYNQSTSTYNSNSGGVAIESATFNDNSYNAGTVWDAVFNDSSAHNNSMGSVIYNNATFNDASNQYGPVNGTITCNTTGVCNATITNGTVLLLHFDGANGSTTFTDSSPLANTITGQGGAPQISTDQSRFGGSSLAVGSGWVSISDSSSFTLGSNDFTIELWYFDSTGNGGTLAGQWGWGYAWYLSTSQLYINNSNVISWTPAASNTWHHVAVCRYSSTINVFIDGVSVGTYTIGTGTIENSSAYIGIGRDEYGNSPLYGYIDEFRMIKGTAVYTSNFTPPSMPLGSEVSLLMHFDSTTGGHFFDSSISNYTITGSETNGTAYNIINTNNKKFGGASADFSNGGYLTIDNSSSLLPATDDFTIEAWVYITSEPSNNVCSLFGANGSLIVGINSTSLGGALYAEHGGVGGLGFTTSNPVPRNEWAHVAVCRSGSTFKLFINGVLGATQTASPSFAPYADYMIGTWSGDMRNFPGYVDELRVVKGAALYSNNFTPPSLPFGTNPSVLLHFDGTSFVDSSPNALTISTTGTPQLSTTQSKFGGSSLLMNGSSRLDLPSSTLFDLENGDYTIEFWYMPQALGNCQRIVTFEGSSDSRGFMHNCNDPSILDIHFFGSGPTITTNSGVLSVGSWVHIALIKSGSTTNLYINGTNTAFTTSQCLPYGDCSVSIGGNYVRFASNDGNGYIDEFSVIKGYAKYTSNFIPEGYTPPSPLSLLMHYDTTFTDSSPNNRSVSVSGNSTISSTESQFGGASAYFDGDVSGGNSYLSINNAGQLSGDFTVEFWFNASSYGSLNRFTFMGTRTGSSGDNGWIIAATDGTFSFDSTSGFGNIFVHSDTTVLINGTTTWSLNTWNHIALCRFSNTMRLFLNGWEIGYTTWTGDFNESTLYVGKEIRTASGANSPYNGYIDELRITNGTAIYTGTFTPPTQAFSS